MQSSLRLYASEALYPFLFVYVLYEVDIVLVKFPVSSDMIGDMLVPRGAAA